MKYLRKETFEATQFTGDNISEVLNLVGEDNFKYGADCESIFIDSYYGLNVTDTPRQVKLKIGDYIMFHGISSVSNRRFQVISKHNFEDEYFEAQKSFNKN